MTPFFQVTTDVKSRIRFGGGPNWDKQSKRPPSRPAAQWPTQKRRRRLEVYDQGCLGGKKGNAELKGPQAPARCARQLMSRNFLCCSTCLDQLVIDRHHFQILISNFPADFANSSRRSFVAMRNKAVSWSASFWDRPTLDSHQPNEWSISFALRQLARTVTRNGAKGGRQPLPNARASST